MTVYSKILSLIGGVPRTTDLSNTSNALGLANLEFLGSSSGYVSLAAASATTSYSLVLPSAQGAAQTFLQNDGSGNLSWTTVATSAAIASVLTAGQAFTADTSYVVRFGMNSMSESTDRVYAADYNTSSYDEFWLIGIAFNPSVNVLAGQPITVYSFGAYALGSSDTPFSSANIGAPVWLTSAGAFSATAPTGDSEADAKIGVIMSTTQIWLDGQMLGIGNVPNGAGPNPLPVTSGGTGLSSLTPYAIMAGGTGSNTEMQQVSGLGTSGYVLTSNGASALPTWQAGGTSLTFADSLVNTAGTVTLVNDSATPGNTKYYGTNGSGTLGYYSIPSTGANTALSNLIATSINESLIPASAGSQVLGSASDYWGPSFVSQFNDLSNLISIGVTDRKLYNTSGLVSVNYDGATLTDSSNTISVDWTNRLLKDTSGSTVVAWANSSLSLIDTTGSGSVAWGQRQLIYTDGTTPMLDWSAAGILNVESNSLTNIASLLLNGSVSGTITQFASATTTSYSITWPAAQAASSGYALVNDGAGNLSWAAASAGSVTSVALSDGSSTPIYSISGSPVTSSGTLTFTLETQTANYVFAGPASGSAAQPGFRSLVSADIPSLAYISTTLGTANGLSVSGNTLSLALASTSTTGALSSTDWNTFNGKQAAGNYITALTGDGTASGPGSAALTLATVNSNIGTFASVTINAKGLATSGAALSGDITTSGSVSTLATVNSNVGSFTNASITVNGKGLITAASSGTAPVTSISIASSNGFAGSSSGGATPALTISTSVTGLLNGNGTAVSAFTMAADTLLGNNTGSTAAPTALTVSQVNTLLGTLSNPMTTQYDMIVGGSSGTPTRLAAGSQYNVLTAGSSGAESWGQVNLAQSAAITGALPVANGGTGLTSIPSGRYYSSTSSITTSYTTTTFATKDYDSLSSYSSGTLTIPAAGKYQINAGIQTGGTFGANTAVKLAIFQNGSEKSEGWQLSGGANGVTNLGANISDIINCAASDTIVIKALSNGTGVTIDSSNFANYFSWIWVGN